MDFILRYSGPLPSNGNIKDKHIIRESFDKQLAELCNQEPLLEQAKALDLPEGILKGRRVEVSRPINNPFYYVNLGGFNFIPLITRPHELACSLDILFLRREKPGAIVHHGGDIDNRLKTLFDSLRLPYEQDEIKGINPTSENQRVYCLLEDDALISKLSVSTHQILMPIVEGENLSNIELLIHVVVQSTYPMWANVGF